MVLSAHSEDGDKVSHHKSSVRYSSDNNSGEMGMEQKLLNTINTSFSKGIREKMSRLLHFIINFGSHLITFNEAGNVIIQDRIIDKQSNILDLLRACVAVTGATKPAGFTAFIQALRQINVPSYFLAVGSKKTVTKTVAKNATQKSKIRNWQPY